MYNNDCRQNADEKPKEECGVFGIYNRNNYDPLWAATQTYYGLYALQHRGQEACGIAVNDFERVTYHKNLGLVGDVFSGKTIEKLTGKIAVGHARYSTMGGSLIENTQPIVARYIKGTLTVAHNGNISNVVSLRRELEKTGAVFQTSSDTEVIALLIARERIKSSSIEEAITKIIPMLEGSYSLVVMSPKKLIAVRDPYGIRPLCMGKIENSYVFASESCALDTIHAEFIRDIAPGEVFTVTEDSEKSYIYPNCPKESSLCIFEHIYFARPDSIIDNQSVYEARLEAGRILARTYPVDADLVFGVPDSGIIAAMGYAEESGIPYHEGMLKNRYIGRTFIQPNNAVRRDSVRIKLNVIANNIRNKRVIMIDDSIVRGNTIEKIVMMLKDNGAKEVHVRISSPEFLWPCYYGTDISNIEELASRHYSSTEFCKKIGANSLGFLPLDKLTSIAKNSKLSFCDACFSGKYVYPVPNLNDKLIFDKQ